MEEPRIPTEEASRLAELDALCILDTPPEERFDRVTRTAQRLFRVSFVLVSLIDKNRQWFKSNQGLGASETPRQISFCGHAILSDAVLVVEDATLDPRFFDNPLVTSGPLIRFYAGVPLHGPNGYRIGTLCIIDTKPRQFSELDLIALKDLGAMIDAELGSEALNQALRGVKDREEKLRAIIDNVIDGIITIDEQGGIETLNPAAIQLFGYQQAEIEGQNICRLMPEPDRSGHDGFLSHFHDTGVDKMIGGDHELIGLRKDGSMFPMELAVSAMTLNGKRGYIGIVRDLSARQQQEKLKAKFAAIIQSSLDVVISNTLDGVIESWNPAAERIFGYTAAEMLGRTMSALIPVERQHEEAEFMAKLRQGLSVDAFETIRIKKDGSRLQVSVTLSPILDGSGKMSAYSQIVRDITAQKHAQRELLIAVKQADQANRAKSEFLANMSHEIRTPMNAVLGVTHLLGNTPLSTEQKNYLDMVAVSGQSLMSILNDILDFSKIEAGKMELCPAPFRLDAMLNALATLMGVNAGEKDLELVIGVGADVPAVLMADALRLQQVLVNLTGNAIKFTECGEVSLRVDLVSSQEDEVAIRFTVRDTGIGMSQEQQNRLFTAFSQADASTTRRFGGTGLGLTISLRLVEMMGGSIDVRSTPGQGSEFSFTLPLARADAEAEALFACDNLGALRLLIVDDNATSRGYLHQTILGCHWQADTVASGEQALERVQQLHSKGENYDAILVDWQMPGMDGLATLQALSALPRIADSALILMASAFGRGKLMQRGMASLANNILAKPITALSLRDALRNAFARKTKEQIDIKPRLRPAAPQRLKAHVLLVEDNALNLVVAKSLLEQAGVTLDSASNGLEAIQLLQAGKTHYDLILMDVQMPIMDGFAATQIIRNELKLIVPILAMTAGVMEAEQKRCTEVGMNDFIAKPIDIGQMFAVINRYMASAAPVASLSSSEVLVSDQSFDSRQLLEVAQSSPEALGQLVEVIRNVIGQAPAQLDCARQAWEGGNGNEAARNLHVLRGSMGTLGANAFCTTSQTIEQAIRDGRNERIATLFDQLEQELTMTIVQAQRWLDRQTP